MRLRSGSLTREDRSRGNLGLGDGNLSRVEIPDLNLIDESDAISSEEGESELNKIKGKSNGSVSEKETGAGECEGMIAGNDENVGVQKSNDIGILGAYSTKADGISGVLHPLANVGVEANEIGGERLNCALGLGSACSGLASVVKNSEYIGEKIVCLGEEEELKEKSSEPNVGAGQEALCQLGLVNSEAVDGSGVSEDISGPVCVNAFHKDESQEEHMDCDLDMARVQQSNAGALKEHSEKKSVPEGSRGKLGDSSAGKCKQGRIQVVDKVLRSRVVPGNRLTDEAVGILARPNKRKREADGREEVAVTLKNDTTKKLAVDSMKTHNSVRPKRSIDLSDGEVVELNKTPRVSKNDDEYANVKSVRSSASRRKRGRPKKSVDPFAEKACTMNEVQAVSEVEDGDLNCRSAPSLKKAECGKRESFDCPTKDDENSKAENAAGDASKSVGSYSLTRRSERSRRVVDYCEKVAVQRKKVSSYKVDDDPENGNEVEGSSTGAGFKINGKRRRPEKVGGDGAVEMISQDQDGEIKVSVVTAPNADSENGNEVVDRTTVASLKIKRKRGRPKKVGGDAVKVISLDQDGKMEVSLTVPDDDPENGTEVEDSTTGASLKIKGKRGRPKKVGGDVAVKVISQHQDGKIEVSVTVPNDDPENGNEVEDNKTGASLKIKGKRGRPKKAGLKIKGKRGRPKKVGLKIKGKRGRPKKVGLKIKGKRGRPKKVGVDGAVKMISQDQGGKVSVVTTPNVGPHLKEVSSDTKLTPGRPDHAVCNSKADGTLLTENVGSVKRKRGGAPGSLSAKKNLIRNQIVDMLLRAGWTVEYRPRNGREYSDAVYVNREGKTHWSVTKAYYTLKREFEDGKVGDFTPVPEEVLSKLFRIVSKTRSDKNKHKGDGDSSDGDTRDEYRRNRMDAKHKHSDLKRKSSVKGGSQSKRRCALIARRSKGLSSESSDAIAHSGKHSILAWIIDSGALSLDGKVHYMNRRKTKIILEGSITRDGIHCNCCKEVISVTEFEKHAGSKLCHPYENLYLESGQSLLQCLLDSWNKQESAGRTGYHSVNVDADDPNDDTCAICGDGGDLMCCDGCPSTFHQDCLEMEEVPSGEWNCVYCSCKFCGAVGDAIDDCDTSSSPLVTCCLCQKKFHQSCIDEEDAVHFKSGTPTFCDKNCQQMYDQLQRLIGTKGDLDDGYSWTLLHRSDVKAEAVPSEAQKIHNNSKLAVALSVMDECFVPIIDPRSGINLIRHVVYNCGSNFNRLNFSSFFTIVLEKGAEVISAASVRIHGKQLAEMPFIGTRNVYRRQGMCRRLLTAIELALGSLDVENLVIPAVPELVNTWTSVFGFQPIEDAVKEDMRSMNMLVFAHIDMLLKPLSQHGLGVERSVAVIENDANCLKSSDVQLSGGIDKSEVDDGCVNGLFDLNVVASSIPESSSEERHDSCISKNCGAVVKSRNDLGDLVDSDKVQGQLIAKEISDTQGESSVLVPNSSQERILQPDLNMGGCSVHPCSATVEADEAAENTINFCGLLKLDSCSTVNDGPDCGGNSASVETTFGERTLTPDLKLMGDNVSEFNHCSPSNVVDHVKGGNDDLYRKNDPCQKQNIHCGEAMHLSCLDTSNVAETHCCEVNTTDNHEDVTVPLRADSEIGSPEAIFSSNCDVLETSGTNLSAQTGVSSISSLLTKSPPPGTSVECSQPDSHVVPSSVLWVTSETSCITSSDAGKSSAAGVFDGNNVPKVGSN